MDNRPPQTKEMWQALCSAGEEEREIDLVELGYELLHKLKYIVLAAVAGVILAAVYSFVLEKPVYEAVAKLYVLNSEDSVVNLSDLQLGNYLASDYTEVFKTWEVNEMVRNNLGLNYTYRQMEEMVRVDNPKDTRILYITVRSPHAEEAMNMANEYAEVVRNYVSRIMATERPNVLSTAILPTAPVAPQKTRNLMLGLFLGLAVSLAAVVIHFVLDDTIKSSEDVTKYTGLTVLAVLPVQGAGETGKYHRKRSRAT